jgi:hypothetical protein
MWVIEISIKDDLGHPQQWCTCFDLDAQRSGDPGRVGPGAVQAEGRSVHLGKLIEGRGQVHTSTLGCPGIGVGSSGLLDFALAVYPVGPHRLPGLAGGMHSTRGRTTPGRVCVAGYREDAGDAGPMWAR